MLFFQCDYVEGAHPNIIKKLGETNFDQTPGYGADKYCIEASEKIKAAAGVPEADVHFLVGGTQANLIAISSILKPYQGVISHKDGHINVHETGAIEATGHKVLALGGSDGLLDAGDVDKYISNHFSLSTHEHCVMPGMVYISFPTESGTLYSKKQLTDLYSVCRKHSVPLFIDGARLGYGITSPNCDLTLEELASLCDMFYIGGTKCGALFGEAIVITDKTLQKDFRYNIKQRGAMLAKGRLLGIQFAELFRDGLYFDICGRATELALKIREAFEHSGIKMYSASPTNQQFPILTDEQIDYFKKKYVFEIEDRLDDNHTVVRFCTSWATKEENVDKLISSIKNMPV